MWIRWILWVGRRKGSIRLRINYYHFWNLYGRGKTFLSFQSIVFITSILGKAQKKVGTKVHVYIKFWVVLDTLYSDLNLSNKLFQDLLVISLFKKRKTISNPNKPHNLTAYFHSSSSTKSQEANKLSYRLLSLKKMKLNLFVHLMKRKRINSKKMVS